MTAGAVGVVQPPEHPPRQTHPDSIYRGRLVVAAARIGIMTYDANGDHRCRLPSLSSWGGDGRRDDYDGRQKGGRGDGKATARQRRGNGKATVRQLQGDCNATTRQQGCEDISYGAAGGRGNEAIFLITNQTFALILRVEG